MKKTISINIAGLIFHIEEDGYDKLRQYLATVHRYFSTFADSTEIVADIESRIAERFLIKQKAENKQAISIEDVEELMAAMGSVSDFEAAEQAEDLLSDPLGTATAEVYPQSEATAGAPLPQRPARGRFYRDLKRKILGGVAGGIAHYYALDPLWVRLLLLLFMFGTVPISGISGMGIEEESALFAGVLLIGYIAMWIAFPGSTTLEENLKVKKFYRDPEHKVLGGVASGLGSYFNVDTGVIRFFWVISIFFFGIGFLAYIILWAIAPAANTLTEKMEMQGEPITLFNIDSNIKRNLGGPAGNRGANGDFRSLLLLPFTIIGKILNALGKVFRELGPVIRVLIGLVMVAFSGSGLLALLIFGAALLGLASMPDFGMFPSEFLALKEMPSVLIFSITMLAIIPVLVILILGLMLLLRRKIIGSTAWIVLAGLFIFSVVGAVSSGAVFQRNFFEAGDYVRQNSFSMGDKKLVIDGEDNYSGKRVDVSVFLKGVAGGDSVSVKEVYFARGSEKSEARELASQIEYSVEKRDSVLFLANGPLQSETLPYRNQHIEITLELPYSKPFVMTRAFFFGKFGSRSAAWKNLEGKDIRHQDLDWNQLNWVMHPDSGLICINFPDRFLKQNSDTEDQNSNWSNNEDFNGVELGDRGEFVKQFAVSEFKGIDLGGAYKVRIKKGDKYTVTIDGSEELVEAFEVKVENGALSIEKDSSLIEVPESGNSIGVVITMPSLESVELSGATLLKIDGFEQLQNLTLGLSGAALADLDVNRIDKLDLELSGVSKMVLKGEISDFKCVLSGSCLLKAGESNIKNAEVAASGVSQAILGNVVTLKKQVSGQSRVSRYGE